MDQSGHINDHRAQAMAPVRKPRFNAPLLHASPCDPDV